MLIEKTLLLDLVAVARSLYKVRPEGIKVVLFIIFDWFPYRPSPYTAL